MYDSGNKLLQVTDAIIGIVGDGGFKDASALGTQYTYDATGIKLKKEVPGKITEYAGNYIYEKIGASTVLQFFNHPEGYVEYDGGSFNYVYNYTDHLGNIRLSYTDANGSIDPSTEIIQEKNYYPFGLTHSGYNSGTNGLGNAAAKRYLFGGKELQDESISGNSLDWYDFSGRNYDPALGRWINIDPLAEDFMGHTPYNAMMNNPVMFIDPDGRAAMSPLYNTDGDFLGTDDEGLQGKAIVMNEENFTQGMSHDKALSNSLGAEGLSSKEAGTKLLSNYNGLKDRPDYDGKVTFGEAIKWYNEGSGDALFIDPNKLDFKFTTVNTVKNAKDGYIDLFPNDPLIGRAHV